MTALWSGCRPHCERVRGELTEYGGVPVIMDRHPFFGGVYFAVDPATVRFEVYHA